MSKYDKQSQKDIVAKNLARLLQRDNKKQVDIVNDLGMSQSVVSDYFGARRYPPPDKMQMLADYFGVLMSDIMEEKPASEEDGLSDAHKELLEIIRGADAQEVERIASIVKLVRGAGGKEQP